MQSVPKWREQRFAESRFEMQKMLKRSARSSWKAAENLLLVAVIAPNFAPTAAPAGPPSVGDLIRFGSITPEIADFLRAPRAVQVPL